MAVEIIMPKAGMDMDEGTITQWLKDLGDPVEEGEALLEIETDKVTMEIESPVSGVLLRRYFDNGDVVPVVTIIAYVGEAGEEVPEHSPITETDLAKGIKATPYARKMAKVNNINLKDVTGTGLSCQIKGRDVKNKIAESSPSKKLIDEQDLDPSRAKPLSGVQKVVADRMLKAHLEIPSVTQNTKVDMTSLLKLRKTINEKREQKLTINDFIVKATAKVLQKDKDLLVSLVESDIIHHQAVNIGIAMAQKQGLVVPVVKDANQKSLTGISAAIKDLSDKAQSGTLLVDDHQGSTISISNLGMFGVHSFTPIINQPNAAIIGICAIEDELALIDGQVVNRKKMMVSLTYDHRLINGHVAAKFALKLKDLLENPLEMLI